MLYLSLEGPFILRTFGLVMAGNVATYYNSRCQEVTLSLTHPQEIECGHFNVIQSKSLLKENYFKPLW